MQRFTIQLKSWSFWKTSTNKWQFYWSSYGQFKTAVGIVDLHFNKSNERALKAREMAVCWWSWHDDSRHDSECKRNWCRKVAILPVLNFAHCWIGFSSTVWAISTHTKGFQHTQCGLIQHIVQWGFPKYSEDFPIHSDDFPIHSAGFTNIEWVIQARNATT